MSHKTLPLGRSVKGRPLEALAIEPKPAPKRWLLVLGGVHGDELEGVWLAEEMRARWSASYPFRNVGVVVWTRVNPDGVADVKRWNGNGVDLNRNLPTGDWTPEVKNPRYPPGPSPASEPENQALVKLIGDLAPAAILSLHSFSKFQVNSNGPARAWAECLAKVCGYPVTEDIGYPTPGSLGTYAGAERKIPTITLEIERGLPREEVLTLHVPVLEEAVRYWEEN